MHFRMRFSKFEHHVHSKICQYDQKHTLFSNFARFCTPKRCTHVHCLVLKNNPNYVIFFTWMISNFRYKWPPPGYGTYLLHTTLYGSAIQKTCAFWKNGLTFENTQSQLTYFWKSNINQTFTNGNGMIWGVMIAIFTEIRHLVEELITFLYFFGPQKLSILTARLNKSLLISTSNSMRGD